MTDWNLVAETLRDAGCAIHTMPMHEARRLAIALCERMARGELVPTDQLFVRGYAEPEKSEE